ncbi:MAG: hypothetical protein GX660_24360 [Clostridiaceae bacterium]|nr:hypothetical protein [Clostridiaceae bacterium]
MTHLSDLELAAYVKNTNEGRQDSVLEEHLSACDECLERYMKALESSDDYNTLCPATDFSDRVMAEIREEPLKKPKNIRKRIPEIMVYYAAAACITLVFSLNGAFQFVSTEIFSVTSGIAASPSRIGNATSSGWRERFVNNTSVLLNELRQETE